MDAQTAMILEQASEGLLMHARDEEKKMAAEIEKMEKLDEDDFELLRQKRKLQMMKKQREQQDWKQLGHGRYMELTDTKEFFNSAKKSSRMVCHFFRGVTPRCEIVDSHLAKVRSTRAHPRYSPPMS